MNIEVSENLLFSTPVWKGSVTQVNNNSIKEYCLEVRNKKPGVIISNRGGWHSKELILPIPKDLENLFDNLTSLVNQINHNYFKISELKLGNWWININGSYDYNMPHDHQKSIISGAYYVSVPEENMGNLVLHRGDVAEYFLPGSAQNNPTSINRIAVNLPVEESMFYIFPSWVKHSVERNESNNERISIAFNFVI